MCRDSDLARVDHNGARAPGSPTRERAAFRSAARIAMSTDTYTVSPLFFGGGDIGRGDDAGEATERVHFEGRCGKAGDDALLEAAAGLQG